MNPLHRRLLRTSRAARGHLGAAVVLGLLTAAAVVAQAALLAHVVAAVFLGGAGLADVSGELIALAGVALARGALTWGFELSGHLAASRVMSELRIRLVDHVLRARPAALAGRRSGELATAAVQGVDALEAYFGRYVPQVALSALVPLAILGWVIPVDLTSAVILAATLPLIPIFMVLVGRAAQGLARRRFRALQTLGGHFVDVVRGLPVLRAHGRAGAASESLAAAGEGFRHETMATLRVAFLSALVLELAAMLGVALVAVTIGVRLVGGGLALEAGLTALVLAPELYAPLRQLGAQSHASTDGLAAAERLHEVLDLAPALAVAERPAPLPDPAAAPLRLEGVGVRYPARAEPALEGVDLELRPGERVALVGLSGSGKSTLAALLVRLMDPDEGRVTVGGRDLREGDPAAWRRMVSWLPQHPGLVAGTVADNVRLADPAASADRVRRALRDANAERFVDALPQGVDTRIGEGGHGLSLGEARRVALARAFVRDAPVVVLDEPTANLDGEGAALVGEAVERLARGRTVLLIVHRLELALRADRVVVLEGGRIVESGPPPELAGRTGAFRALLEADAATVAA